MLSAIQSTWINNHEPFCFGFSRTHDEVQSAVPPDSQEGTERKESTSREKYEQKRKITGHGFQKEWLSEFIWLDYDEKEGQGCHSLEPKKFPDFSLTFH